MHLVPGKLGSSTKVDLVLACRISPGKGLSSWTVQTVSTNVYIFLQLVPQIWVLFSSVEGDFIFLTPSHSLKVLDFCNANARKGSIFSVFCSSLPRGNLAKKETWKKGLREKRKLLEVGRNNRFTLQK